jgi:3-isopropylmalate dehydrogenase
MLEAAVETVLAGGLRTADLLGPAGGAAASTTEMGDAIVAALEAGR